MLTNENSDLKLEIQKMKTKMYTQVPSAKESNIASAQPKPHNMVNDSGQVFEANESVEPPIVQNPQEDPEIETRAEVTPLSLEEQWNVCKLERRQRYEQYLIGQKAAEQQRNDEKNSKKKKKQRNQKEKGNNGKIQNETEKSSNQFQRKEDNEKQQQTTKTHTTNPEKVPEETQKGRLINGEKGQCLSQAIVC